MVPPAARTDCDRRYCLQLGFSGFVGEEFDRVCLRARLLRSSPARSWSARPQRKVELAEARDVPGREAPVRTNLLALPLPPWRSEKVWFLGYVRVVGVSSVRVWVFAQVGPHRHRCRCRLARVPVVVSLFETGSGSACFSSTTSPAKPGGGFVRSRPLSGSGCGIGNPTATLPIAPSLPKCTESA